MQLLTDQQSFGGSLRHDRGPSELSRLAVAVRISTGIHWGCTSSSRTGKSSGSFESAADCLVEDDKSCCCVRVSGVGDSAVVVVVAARGSACAA